MITILTDVKDIAMTGFCDVRSFIKGEIEELSEANERLLIELGLVKPTQ